LCHATHSHFALLHNRHCLLQTSRRNTPEKLNVENEGTRECIPLFLSNDQEITCPERHTGQESDVVDHLTGKLFPQGHDTKYCSPS
jgi:hypothetical protein